MTMSFQQYIDNPMGKRNAVFSQRDLFKQLYTEKFDKVFLREAGKINYVLYIDKEKDRYVAHIKVPSETIRASITMLSFYFIQMMRLLNHHPAYRIILSNSSRMIQRSFLLI